MDTQNTGTQVFDHPPSTAELVDTFARTEEKDPRSLFYQRQLVRPKIPVFRLLLVILFTGGLCVAAGLAVESLTGSGLWSVLAAVAALLLIAVLGAKHILIWAVKLYQALAPARVRKRCRYEPSCSVYMILSVEKLGFWKGLKKGLARWNGCKPPNGGYDWP